MGIKLLNRLWLCVALGLPSLSTTWGASLSDFPDLQHALEVREAHLDRVQIRGTVSTTLDHLGKHDETGPENFTIVRNGARIYIRTSAARIVNSVIIPQETIWWDGKLLVTQMDPRVASDTLQDRVYGSFGDSPSGQLENTLGFKYRCLESLGIWAQFPAPEGHDSTKDQFTLLELLRKASLENWLTSLKRKEGGLIELDVRPPTGLVARYHYIFDMNRGAAIVKFQQYLGDPKTEKLALTITPDHFEDHQGVSLPHIIRLESGPVNSELVYTDTLEIIAINIGESAQFPPRIEFPAHSVITDYVGQAAYETDSSGNVKGVPFLLPGSPSESVSSVEGITASIKGRPPSTNFQLKAVSAAKSRPPLPERIVDETHNERTTTVFLASAAVACSCGAWIIWKSKKRRG